MAGITLKSLLELANSYDAKPSTRIHFRLANTFVGEESVKLKFFKGGLYNDKPEEIEVQISTEFIEARVKERMKQMFAQHVEAMFEPKEMSP